MDTIPGIDQRTAEVLIAELDVDMRVFPTAATSRVGGLCPGNNESAGKHKSCKTRKGSRWLRAALIEAALAAMCYRGFAKNRHRLVVACALANLFIMRKRLLRFQEA